MKVNLAVAGHAMADTAPAGACAWLLGDGTEADRGDELHSAGFATDWQRNRLLASLPPALRLRWATQGECVYLRQGQMLHEAGAVLHWVYFPITALVSLSMQDRGHASSEVATVGREGVVGLPLLDGNYTRSRAVVQLAGRAVRMRASTLADEFSRQSAVRRLLLAYSQALVSEVMQTALCSRHHTLEQQLCRLILLRLDRQSGSELSLTQEAMAGMMGVRRESVTLAAARLQQAGVIRYARGHIAVLDRPGLETRTCDCYDTLRREFERLLRPRPAL